MWKVQGSKLLRVCSEDKVLGRNVIANECPADEEFISYVCPTWHVSTKSRATSVTRTQGINQKLTSHSLETPWMTSACCRGRLCVSRTGFAFLRWGPEWCLYDNRITSLFKSIVFMLKQGDGMDRHFKKIFNFIPTQLSLHLTRVSYNTHPRTLAPFSGTSQN